MRLHSLLIIAATLQPAFAQPKLAPALLGYAYDPNLRAIRSIRGMPGAALLDAPVDPGFPVEAAVIAPRQDFSLAVSAIEHAVWLIRLDSGAAAILDGALNAPGQMVFSPSGAAAILYDAAGGRMQIVTGLPDSPVIQEPSLSGIAVGAFAVADDGFAVVASGATARAIGTDLNSFALSLPANLAAIAFDRSTHDLTIAAASGDIYSARTLETAPDVRQIYQASESTANPVAVRLSAEGSAVLTANAAGTVSAIDLTSGEAESLSCACAPVGIEPLGRVTLFRVTSISHGPVWLFEGAPGRRSLWFVPAEAQGGVQ